MHHPKERARLVELAHRHLEAAGRPRLVMLSVLTVTLAVGFLASVALVHLGVARMPVRYPLAVASAYAAFLGLLWVWLRRQTASEMLADDPEGLLVPGVAAVGLVGLAKGPDGTPVVDAPVDEEKHERNGSGGCLGGGNWGDGGEGFSALVVLVLIAGLCTLIVSIYLVATSPLLLAELLVDGALLRAMSRATGLGSAPHWSRAVVRRTWLAALITAVVFGLVGFGIEQVVPGAHTLGEAWAVENNRR